MNRFTGHLGKIVVVNATWSVRTVFNIVISLCDDVVKAKIKICGKDLGPDLHSIVNKNCLEAKYGGTCPDKVDHFFPPDMSIPGETLLPSEFEQKQSALKDEKTERILKNKRKS
jgi:hypothetical protein